VGKNARGSVVPMRDSMYDADGRRRYRPTAGPHDRIDGHPLLEAMAAPSQQDVEALANAMVEALVSDDWLLPRAQAAFKATETGPFSHTERRRVLGEIYRQALS
jgi:hypothetical protein